MRTRCEPSPSAELLGTTVAAVNSALERARATLRSHDAGDPLRPLDPQQQALLSRYLEAFERFDLDALTSLLHLDACGVPKLRSHLQIT